jgi:NitT/TauT family transport system substrate-binding protein
MQMYASKKYGAAEATRFDKYTVSMTHPDGVVALVSGSGAITAHFTSPPFHQREIEDPRVHTVMNSDDVMGGSTTFTMVSTTSAFREKNPTAYAAVLAAIGEANELIIKDKKMAAQLLVASGGGGGLSAEKLEKMLQSAEIQFTTTPENTLKYAEFMHSIGSLKNRPTSWKDLFFPEIHGAPGS